eukprot:Filipodium_phascolosomae@DN1700_c0_g2_i1.p1
MSGEESADIEALSALLTRVEEPAFKNEQKKYRLLDPKSGLKMGRTNWAMMGALTTLLPLVITTLGHAIPDLKADNANEEVIGVLETRLGVYKSVLVDLKIEDEVKARGAAATQLRLALEDPAFQDDTLQKLGITKKTSDLTLAEIEFEFTLVAALNYFLKGKYHSTTVSHILQQRRQRSEAHYIHYK